MFLIAIPVLVFSVSLINGSFETSGVKESGLSVVHHFNIENAKTLNSDKFSLYVSARDAHLNSYSKRSDYHKQSYAQICSTPGGQELLLACRSYLVSQLEHALCVIKQCDNFYKAPSRMFQLPSASTIESWIELTTLHVYSSGLNNVLQKVIAQIQKATINKEGFYQPIFNSNENPLPALVKNFEKEVRHWIESPYGLEHESVLYALNMLNHPEVYQNTPLSIALAQKDKSTFAPANQKLYDTIVKNKKVQDLSAVITLCRSNKFDQAYARSMTHTQGLDWCIFKQVFDKYVPVVDKLCSMEPVALLKQCDQKLKDVEGVVSDSIASYIEECQQSITDIQSHGMRFESVFYDISPSLNNFFQMQKLDRTDYAVCCGHQLQQSIHRNLVNQIMRASKQEFGKESETACQLQKVAVQIVDESRKSNVHGNTPRAMNLSIYGMQLFDFLEACTIEIDNSLAVIESTLHDMRIQKPFSVDPLYGDDETEGRFLVAGLEGCISGARGLLNMAAHPVQALTSIGHGLKNMLAVIVRISALDPPDEVWITRDGLAEFEKNTQEFMRDCHQVYACLKSDIKNACPEDYIKAFTSTCLEGHICGRALAKVGELAQCAKAKVLKNISAFHALPESIAVTAEGVEVRIAQGAENYALSEAEQISSKISKKIDAGEQAIEKSVVGAESQSQSMVASKAIEANKQGPKLTDALPSVPVSKEVMLPQMKTYEDARNKALELVKDVNYQSGYPHVGNVGVCENKLAGRRWENRKVTMRLDYDPLKGPHINVVDSRMGKGLKVKKFVIPFEGDEKTVETLLKHLNTPSSLEQAKLIFTQAKDEINLGKLLEGIKK